MHKDAILYNGIWLMPGSEALSLLKEKKKDKLDKLLKECENSRMKLEGDKDV